MCALIDGNPVAEKRNCVLIHREDWLRDEFLVALAAGAVEDPQGCARELLKTMEFPCKPLSWLYRPSSPV